MKKIELFFENEEGRSVKYSLDHPEEPVDAEAVSDAMDEVISQNAFESSGGEIVAKKSARVVENIIEDIDLGL